jgi:hypothetical protein
MILFVGCSFTWGAGLQYEYLIEQENYSFEQIQKMIPPDYFLERCSYKADKYRQEKHFPNIVAKYFDSAYCLAKNGNGGNNEEISRLVQDSSTRVLGGQGQCKLMVIQFTDWQRSYHNGHKVTDLEQINGIIKTQIDSIRNNIGDTKWVGISWFEDIGKVMKKYYPQNYVPIFERGEELTGFEKLCNEGGGRSHSYTIAGWGEDRGGHIPDTHFNSYGHQFIAKQIIKKIKENDLI